MALTITVPPLVKVVDYDRLVDCIQAVEGNKWSADGGALGFTRKAWYEDSMGTPYFFACQEKPARTVAIRRLKRFSLWFEKHNYDPTPERLGQAWRHFLFAAVRRPKYDKAPLKDADYGERVANLYDDPTFHP